VIVNDILDFSKLEAGRLDLNPTEFQLRDTIDEALTALAVRAHEKGLELLCEVPAGVPDTLVADVGRFRQLVVNLVGNAVKFTEAGEVFVRVASEPPADGEIVLHVSVADTGIGVPKEKQAMIFDAFSQADGSTTRRFGGTGLGLSISTRLVSIMGGRLWVESEAGQGSTFHFTIRVGVRPEHPAETIPAALAGRAVLVADDNSTPASQQAPAPSRSHGPSLRILLAEDNAVNQRVAIGLLKKAGHTVTLAENGKLALEALEAATFDLVLMDMQMPEMNGSEAIAAIRAREAPQGGHLPIIALTAHALKGDRERCLAAGADDYLAKPIVKATLYERIADVIATRRPPAPVTAAAVFDRTRATALLARVGGDPGLFRDVIELFLDDCPNQLDAIRQAIHDQQPDRIYRTAHKLKGSAGNFEAHEVVALLQRLEARARDGDLAICASVFVEIEAESERLMAALADATVEGEPTCVS
jgi:CheY-like chemotaxis protein